MAKMLLLLLVALAVAHGRVIFEDCGSGYELEEVDISGCDRSVPCYITVGEQRNITARFTSLYSSHSLTQGVYVMINNVQTNILVTPTPCQATWCPVPSSSQAAYSAKFSLPVNIALKARGKLRWQLFNEKGSSIICFDVIIETQSPFTKLLRSLMKEGAEIPIEI